jgi:hypothetical protein
VRIYELVPEMESFDDFVLEHDDDHDVFLDGFRGEPMAAEWRRIPMARLERAGATLGVPDFPLIPGPVRAIGPRAAQLLDPLIVDHVELLPLETEVGEYYAINVLTILDVLDEERSEGDWFAPGRGIVIRKWVLREGEVDLPPIFKIPQEHRTYITEEFVDAVREHGLTGLDPKLVWDDSSGA